MESDSKFAIPTFPDFAWWDRLRKFLNHYLKLKVIAKSPWFELAMFIIVIFNCGITIKFIKLAVVLAMMFMNDSNETDILG
jgi:hypothetical protein